MSWAERVYAYRTNGKGIKQDKEDIVNRMIQRRNRLFARISKISIHKEIIRVNNELKVLEVDGYKDNNDLIMLRKQMKEQVQELKQTLATNREEIIKKQDSLKTGRYSENIDTLSRVNTDADNIFLQLLMQLLKDNVRRKVIVSDMMKRQEKQDKRVAEVGKELADMTMKRFMLDKAEAVIFPKENVVFE